MLNGGGPIYTDRPTIENYQAGLGEVFGAALRNDVDTSFLADKVRQGRQALIAFGYTAQTGRDLPRYDAETARRKVKDADVQMTVPDDGMSVPEFETMLALRKRQKREETTVARRPKTWAGFGASVAGSLTATAVDPINVASAFIPVVGPARYAMWLERAGTVAGRAGVRVGVGATEGLVGSTLYEAVNASTNRSLPENYGLRDSFLNIAFGTVLGGGLHVMGGAVADRFTTRARIEAGRAPEPRARAALNEAVTAADAGRRVDVAPVFRRADPLTDPMADTRFLTQEAGRAIDVADVDVERALSDIQAVRAGITERPADLVETIKGMGGIRLTDKAGNVTSEGGDVRAIFDKRYPPGLVNNKTGVPLDTVRERLQEDGWLRPWDGEGENPTSINDVLDLLSAWKGGKKPVRAGEGPIEDLTPVREEAKAAGITKADSEEVAAFKLARHRAEKAYAETVAPAMADPVVEPDVFDPATGHEPADMAELREQANYAVNSAENDGAITAELDGEIDALGEYLNMARTRERLTVDDEAALALADEFEAKAKLSGDAYKAAAACLSGLA